MLSVRQLKEKLELNEELTELLDVLKGISSSEFRALERKKERFVRFLDAFEGFYQMIDFSSVEHPFAKGEGGLCIIMITSDEGFMGGLNARVINTALRYPGADKATFVVIGERGANYLKGLRRNFVSLPGISSKEKYDTALNLKNYIIKEVLSYKFGTVILVYPKPISFGVQKIEILKILPCSELFEKKKTKMAEKIIIESSLSEIIDYLLESWITEKLLEVIEDSKLSEFSARAVHLEESHQALLQRSKALKFQFFRSYHELVDKEMREMFSARIIRKREIDIKAHYDT